MFWFFGREECGILVPRSGIELTPPCIGRRSLNHWTARQVSIILLLVISHRKFLFENESLVAECKELRQHTTLCKQNEECTVLGVNIALLLDMKPHCFCNMQAPDNVQFKALCR